MANAIPLIVGSKQARAIVDVSNIKGAFKTETKSIVRAIVVVCADSNQFFCAFFVFLKCAVEFDAPVIVVDFEMIQWRLKMT
jgi:hypothetical protein